MKNEIQPGTLEYANQAFGKAQQLLNNYYASARNEAQHGTELAIKAAGQGQKDVAAASLPFTLTATDSMNEIRQFLGLPGANGTPALTGDQVSKKLEATPGYKFAVDQGNQAMSRTQAAKGMLGSGNALIEAQQFGQGLAQQNYQGHLQNLFKLNGIAQPIASANIANIANTATNVAQLRMQQGNQAASLYQAQGNAIGNMQGQQAKGNLDFAMLQSSQQANAAQNNMAGAGAMAGLQASGYLGGKF